MGGICGDMWVTMGGNSDRGVHGGHLVGLTEMGVAMGVPGGRYGGGYVRMGPPWCYYEGETGTGGSVGSLLWVPGGHCGGNRNGGHSGGPWGSLWMRLWGMGPPWGYYGGGGTGVGVALGIPRSITGVL